MFAVVFVCRFALAKYRGQQTAHYPTPEMTTPPIIARFQVDYGVFQLTADLCLPGSGITVLFGHSGSGKTTLLRCIAGLHHAKQGFLNVKGSVWQDSEQGLFVPTHKRSLGYVFQEANLFSHLSVTGNLQFGLKRIGKPPDSTEFKQIIELLGIGHLLDRMPHNLSGGERQRVAIARALAINPDVLLMDEPLASLDFKRKREIMPFLSQLHQTLKIPVVYVTHSRQEVEQLADYLVILDEGNILVSGKLAETMAQVDKHYF
jgi:molybdate transport system ATP-binding protein